MRTGIGFGLLAAWLPALATAQQASFSDSFALSASWRLRGEAVSWFDPPASAADDGARRYGFLGSQLRVGARATFPNVSAGIDVQDTRLVALPDDASLAAPFGSLGPGATYFTHTRDRNQGETFLKQAFVTVRRSGLAGTVGRFDLGDGLETIPGDRTLAALKRTRIAERLIGPFGYTHVTRSFDALRVALDRPAWNATAFGGFPTRGGFEVSANRTLEDMTVAGASVTAKKLPGPPSDVRAFYLYYEDRRDRPVKVDNRPLAVRSADRRAIRIHTAGAHALSVIEAGPGAIDLLAWGAVQTGDWGRQDHFAWTYAAELGYQVAALPAAPWLRAGWNRASGDDDPGDRDHDTFFQLLPTARAYAQLPFYNLMNSDDWFAQLILQPHPLLTMRTEYHYLRLTDRSDLWYAGGGASNEKLFGFSGVPARGQRTLAHVADLTVTLGPIWKVWLSAYYGHAFGGRVIESTFPGEDADYFFSELTFRY